MFADEVTVLITAGKGGDGCTSFRREKYVAMGGPNGGNGGHGANIIFKCEKGLKTLIDLKMMKHVKGHKGENGRGSDQNGKNAEDVIIKIPCGTTITNLNDGTLIADLVKEDDEVIVAHGGRGGRGNRAFATHDNPAPRLSELGEPGEEIKVKCELKVLADVGLVGMPSVGKSTLINMISNCNAKVGAYHFTTLNPNLGVVKMIDGNTFVMADLPGLIEGASEGIGLGDKFLRHAMRTKVIAHVVDMGASEGRNPSEDFEKIKTELLNYDVSLANKPHIIIASKMDEENALDNLEKFKREYPDEIIFPISSYRNEGFEELIKKLGEMVSSLEEVKLYEETKNEAANHVVFKFTNTLPFTIKRENNVWVLSGDEIEKLFNMTRFNEEESVERFARKLKGMGVDEELERLGAQRGDEVMILDYVFEFKD